jgi:hypothetical protein
MDTQGETGSDNGMWRTSDADSMAATRVPTKTPTELLPPWSTVLLEKLTDAQTVKKFQFFYGS